LNIQEYESFVCSVDPFEDSQNINDQSEMFLFHTLAELEKVYELKEKEQNEYDDNFSDDSKSGLSSFLNVNGSRIRRTSEFLSLSSDKICSEIVIAESLLQNQPSPQGFKEEEEEDIDDIEDPNFVEPTIEEAKIDFS
jgi:hypothetical protein